MDVYNSTTGVKVIGIGEAVVLQVRQVPNQPAHQIRISHPDIGDTAFIPYIPPAGMYRVPRLGDVVYVFCNENFHQYPVAWGHRISPELAKQLVGDRADTITVIYSSGANNRSIAHKIELDDGTNAGIRVITGGGNKIDMKDSGTITVAQKSGGTIVMSDDTITMQVSGCTFVMGADGITMQTPQGSKMVLDGSINGKAADSLATFDKVVISTHTHTGNLSFPTSVPKQEGSDP
jgi:hypothetical protein